MTAAGVAAAGTAPVRVLERLAELVAAGMAAVVVVT